MLVCPKCGGSYTVDEGFCPMDGAPLQARAVRRKTDAEIESMVGTVLDRRYRLDELVGRGGMAYVFRATHTLIGKTLAVKVIRPDLARDPDIVKRFLREAQVVSSIKHPNVVDISDFGTRPEGGAFYVMEFLRGRTLADRIDHGGGPLAPEEALAVALQVCQGLQAAHDQGVVHRDLKPENVFICEAKPGKERPVKLLDFGIARAGNRITVAGAVLGTPEYMSPEQAKGIDVDHRADLYGLGVILFEMLTGLVPFRSDDVTLTMHSHIHAEPPTLSGVDTTLTYLSRTDRLLRQLLAKKADDRPGTAKSTAELLHDAVKGDLGEDAAARVAKATMAIGSGGIAAAAAERSDEESTWQDRAMPWDGTDAASQPVPLPPELEEPLPRRTPVPLIMTGTALLAAVVTVGTYAALGGFGGFGAAPQEPAPAPVIIPAQKVEPPVTAVAGSPDPEPDPPIEDPISAPVPAGGGEGVDVAKDEVAGAAPTGESGPDSEVASSKSPPAKAKPRKGKHHASTKVNPKPAKASKDKPAPDPESGSSPTSESKQKPSKRSNRSNAPGDLKDPFGAN